MKHLLLLSSLLLSAAPLLADEYVTPGDGQAYSLDQLADLTNNLQKTDAGEYLLSGDITLSAGDELTITRGVVLMADGTTLTLNGKTTLLNQSGAILFTRASDEAVPRGIRVADDNAEFSACGVGFEFIAIQYMSTQPITLIDCTFRQAGTALTSTAALTFSRSSADNYIYGCKFIQCESAAIGGALNYANGMAILNCSFYDNNTQNTNKPQINLISGGDAPVYIQQCSIIGTGRDMVGGIGFMNYMNPGDNNIYIEGNTIANCRYGIAAYSYQPLNFQINDNTIVNNCYETNPNNGGSGITLYDMSVGTLSCTARGNYLEGNLWGVTVLGSPASINFGYLGDDESLERFAGCNTFVGNGNTDVDYEFFNNTSSAMTIYAQGNVWGSGSQDSTLVASLVWDANDAGGQGEVVFTTPAQADPVQLSSVSADRASDGHLDVFSLSGTRALMEAAGGESAFSDLLQQRGLFVVRDSQGQGRIVSIK